MKINMEAARVSAILKASVMPILACIVGLSNSANAEYVPASIAGAQVCQPANLSQAQIGGGISWQSSGIFNNTGLTLWVICSLNTSVDAYTGTDTFYLVRNNNGVGSIIQGVTKVINQSGTTYSTSMVNLVVTAYGYVAGDGYFGKEFFGQSASISFKLPTGTGVVSVTSVSYDLI